MHLIISFEVIDTTYFLKMFCPDHFSDEIKCCFCLLLIPYWFKLLDDPAATLYFTSLRT